MYFRVNLCDSLIIDLGWQLCLRKVEWELIISWVRDVILTIQPAFEVLYRY